MESAEQPVPRHLNSPVIAIHIAVMKLVKEITCLQLFPASADHTVISTMRERRMHSLKIEMEQKMQGGPHRTGFQGKNSKPAHP